MRTLREEGAGQDLVWRVSPLLWRGWPARLGTRLDSLIWLLVVLHVFFYLALHFQALADSLIVSSFLHVLNLHPFLLHAHALSGHGDAMLSFQLFLALPSSFCVTFQAPFPSWYVLSSFFHMLNCSLTTFMVALCLAMVINAMLASQRMVCIK